MIQVVAAPRPASPALEARLLSACSDAARPSRCELSDTAAASGEAATVVGRDPDVVDIELVTAWGSHETRRIVFRQEDHDEDRWQAIGLVIAALHGEAAARAAPEAAPPPSGPAHPAHRRLHLSGGANVGDGLAPGPARFGAWARFDYQPKRSVMLFGVGAGYASSSVSGSGVRPTWVPLLLGVGAEFGFQPTNLAVRPRIDLVLEHQEASVEVGAASGSGTRWLPGVATSLELVVPQRAPLSVVFGGGARFLTGGTAVRVREERVSSFPAHSFSVVVGLELSLDSIFGLGPD